MSKSFLPKNNTCELSLDGIDPCLTNFLRSSNSWSAFFFSEKKNKMTFRENKNEKNWSKFVLREN